MSLRDFLNKKNELKETIDSRKEEFRLKCILVLEEIGSLNQDRYHELMKIFSSQYDGLNVKRKRLLGFYAQCKNELQKLKKEAQTGLQDVKKVVKTTTKKVANTLTQKIVKAPVKKAEKEPAEKVAKKTVKKTAKKAEKKVAKKAPSKAAAKPAKKTAKKVAKKTAKKTSKK